MAQPGQRPRPRVDIAADHGLDAELGAGLDEELGELLDGLRRRPARVSPKYFYDEKGSQLFEAICAQPEYYPTRTELAIMERHLDEIVALIGAEATLIEYGSGASLKTRLLLDRLDAPAAYVPVDISREHLAAVARRLGVEFPGIEMLPVAADFTRALPFPRPARPSRRRVLYFPGSTIGNFSRQEAIGLLRQMRQDAGPGGNLLIGVDLLKPVAVLEQAYNDVAGITAAFNLNLLEHLNHRFGADFTPADFEHRAIWDGGNRRIEMRLVSRRQQAATIHGMRIAFAPQEFLVTEHSHKYTPAGFAALTLEAGWRVARLWTDQKQYFSVQYLVPA
ncbi:MAG: L-histidine N(alpha)-methyltransferase [Gammaproteobacteria bacterium PRO9]|nr:L-histidine N(alpha)-methyltransferase [Gammaproteobacteria bacterium PRO9]